MTTPQNRDRPTAYNHLKVDQFTWDNPDSKDHGANMGPTWVLSAPVGPHVGPVNLAIKEDAMKSRFHTSWRNILKATKHLAMNIDKNNRGICINAVGDT